MSMAVPLGADLRAVARLMNGPGPAEGEGQPAPPEPQAKAVEKVAAPAMAGKPAAARKKGRSAGGSGKLGQQGSRSGLG